MPVCLPEVGDGRVYACGTLAHWLARPENAAPRVGGERGVIDRDSEKGALVHLKAIECTLQAITFIHAHPAVHGDIKLENILVKSTRRAELPLGARRRL